jgi:hypothetical protein
MPCPLFLPASPLTGFTDLHGGECASQPGALIPVDTLRRCCNAGYARATCVHAAQSDADAFRFLIKSNCDGVVGVAWSIERDHHPVAVGTLVITNTVGTEGPLERQARAYVQAYFRQSH